MKKIVSILLCFSILFLTLIPVSAGGVFICEVIYKDFKAEIVGEGGAPRLFLTEYCGNAQTVSIPTTISANELIAMIPDSDKNSFDYEEFILNEVVSGDMLIEIVISDEDTFSTEITRYKNYDDKLKVFIDGKKYCLNRSLSSKMAGP